MPHILKKYILTSRQYKFLDIGIVIGSVSYVQIAIGDDRGNVHIISSWKMFIKRRADIERLLQSTVPSSSSIQDLNVKLVKIYDTNNVKLIN